MARVSTSPFTMAAGKDPNDDGHRALTAATAAANPSTGAHPPSTSTTRAVLVRPATSPDNSTCGVGEGEGEGERGGRQGSGSKRRGRIRYEV